jgi:hypothetical protein
MSCKNNRIIQPMRLYRRAIFRRNWLLIIAVGILSCIAGCLDRPVGLSKPVTTNVVVQKQANNAVTGIDLLLMIDNSSSMADKQTTLAAAVPQLLSQLVQPNCIDDSTTPPTVVGKVQLGAPMPCTQGSPEFNPVNNIHIGIVTSSLGDHGGGTAAAALCYTGAPTSAIDANGQNIPQPLDVNDKSHLMGTLARGVDAMSGVTQEQNATIDAQGFLAWGSSTLTTAPNDTDLIAATTIFKDLVIATTERGCGFEAQLEGWFRFLIDPVPPILPLQPPDAKGTHRIGSDDELLAQRAAFLRPDSLLAIVMLTDENDCSVRDTDVGYVATTTDQVSHSVPSIQSGSPMCATNPNDKCCFSCTAPIAGCAPCTGTPAVDDGASQINLRCWQQKRRFGYEFLYPTSRYVVGLTKKVLCPDQTFGDMDCDCAYAKKIGAGCDPGSRQMPNPLYNNVVGQKNDGKTNVIGYKDAIPRADNSAIFLAGIVGVPWQDIGKTDASGNLSYIPVTDPAWTSGTDPNGTQPNSPGANGIWSQIYGDDSSNIEPQDVHMQESVVPRPGLPGPSAAADADPFNGHEYNTDRIDLEYACIYQLPTANAKPCACLTGTASDASCRYLHPNDCCITSDQSVTPPSDFNKPICSGNTQVAAKGYPGLREIAVLRDYAMSAEATTPGNSIVASICPKDLTSAPQSDGYGYNPAVAALINRLKDKLRGSCLPRPLTVRDNGTVPCNVVEVVPSQTDCNSYCKSKGRDVAMDDNPSGLPSSQMTAAVTDSMQKAGLCGGGNRPACASMCLCLLNQESGADLNTCQTGDENAALGLPPGYCYIDPAAGVGSEGLVANCPETQRRILRYVGNNINDNKVVPLAGSTVFTACQGSAVGQ